jgi:hypothetical protein
MSRARAVRSSAGKPGSAQRGEHVVRVERAPEVNGIDRKYGPWLVKPERLYQAMNPFDRSAEKKRGLLLIE